MTGTGGSGLGSSVNPRREGEGRDKKGQKGEFSPQEGFHHSHHHYHHYKVFEPSLPPDPSWFQQAQFKRVVPQLEIPSFPYFYQLNRCYCGKTCFVMKIPLITQEFCLNLYRPLDISYHRKASHHQPFSSPLQIEDEGTETPKQNMTYLGFYSKLELQSRTKSLSQPSGCQLSVVSKILRCLLGAFVLFEDAQKQVFLFNSINILPVISLVLTICLVNLLFVPMDYKRETFSIGMLLVCYLY